MRLPLIAAVLGSILMVGLSACQKKSEQSTTEHVDDRVGDALDTRPHEELRDAAEDAGDAVSKAGEGIKKEVEDAKNGADK